MSRVSSAKLFIRKNLFRKSIWRRRFFRFLLRTFLNVNFVVTVFDPNTYQKTFAIGEGSSTPKRSKISMKSIPVMKKWTMRLLEKSFQLSNFLQRLWCSHSMISHLKNGMIILTNFMHGWILKLSHPLCKWWSSNSMRDYPEHLKNGDIHSASIDSSKYIKQEYHCSLEKFIENSSVRSHTKRNSYKRNSFQQSVVRWERKILQNTLRDKHGDTTHWMALTIQAWSMYSSPPSITILVSRLSYTSEIKDKQSKKFLLDKFSNMFSEH